MLKVLQVVSEAEPVDRQASTAAALQQQGGEPAGPPHRAPSIGAALESAAKLPAGCKLRGARQIGKDSSSWGSWVCGQECWLGSSLISLLEIPAWPAHLASVKLSALCYHQSAGLLQGRHGVDPWAEPRPGGCGRRCGRHLAPVPQGDRPAREANFQQAAPGLPVAWILQFVAIPLFVSPCFWVLFKRRAMGS
jgi:hypothetical protein